MRAMDSFLAGPAQKPVKGFLRDSGRPPFADENNVNYHIMSTAIPPLHVLRLYTGCAMPRRPTPSPTPDLGKRALGRNLAGVRKERGFTQVELAERLGIIQALVSDYERGKLRLSAEMAVRFAHALGVPLDRLLGSGAAPPREAAPRRRVLRRLQMIEKLPRSQQAALLTTIDNFLKGAKAS
jgi:transcriptional regulator with XRE-family HTH domain